MISLARIKAILLHEYFITTHSFEVINDIIFYPLWSIIVFGFLTMYLLSITGLGLTQNILAGIILYQVISITQYSIAVGCLWDVWSRNLTNIFITPVTLREYLLAYTISGSLKAFLVLTLATIVSMIIFHFNLLTLGIENLILIFINLVMFAFVFAILILGLLFRFGTRIQALSWGLISMLQPLMAVVYPVKILPPFLQPISYLLPPTYLFEAMRINFIDKKVQWNFIGPAFILNLIYMVISIWFFNTMFRKSKEIGQFAKLEG
ncbi:ABC transporter permease [Candidatus Roizmanbacteria bacterium]|nr:ABC transporter permease [Candidatus Roizmanbacteria bacterium]